MRSWKRKEELITTSRETAFPDSLKVRLWRKLTKVSQLDALTNLEDGREAETPPPPAAGAIVCPVPSLVGTGRSSIPRPKIPGCCLQVQRQWGPAFEQVQRQWGPDLWSQPLLKSAVPVAPLTLPLPPVGHFKGFPRSFLESAQSQHLQPSHWSPKYPIHPFLLKRPGIKPWLSCLQCVLLHLQLVLSKTVTFYFVTFSWIATSSCMPCHILLVNFHNTTNEIHIITPILQWGGLSMFTQLTIELGIHSAILPPSKSFHREYRTNIQMRER